MIRKLTIRLAVPAILVLLLAAVASWCQNTVQTIAGGGPNNLPALKSSMGLPIGFTRDGAGNLYVADVYSARVLRVDTTGNVTVFAGYGARGFTNATSDGIPAVSAYMAYLAGVAVDSFGNVFVADSSLCVLRKISAQAGTISTVAGTLGNCSYSGDGGPATLATFGNLESLAIDGSNNIFVTDACVVRKISAQTGNIAVIAGTPADSAGIWRCGYSGDGGPGTSARIGLAYGLAVDGFGDLLIADTNCVIREVSGSTGMIFTVAGTGVCGYSGDGGAATNAKLAFSSGLSTNLPNGLALDASGNLYIADTANCAIRKISASSGTISTFAGGGSCGYSGDGGPATGAALRYPTAVSVDSTGNILIADSYNSVIRKVSVSGTISTFAGVSVPDPRHAGQKLGFPAYSGDGYPGPNGSLGFLNATPWSAGMFTDQSGNVLIADTFNHVIRKISAATGIITTVAGNGVYGYSGDGGPATSAELFYPRDVTVDIAGNIFIMDSGNCVVRKVSAATGIISTVAGTPPDASGNYYCDYFGDGVPATSALLYPLEGDLPAGGLAVDGSGNIFIADTGNRVIRKVSASTGIITTISGIPLSPYIGLGDGGPAISATFADPFGIAVDNSGNIFIADTYDYAIREIMAENGNIYTVAGNISLGRGFSGDGGPANSAQLGYVYSMFLDPAGNLFIPDTDHCVIREVSSSTGLISTVAGTPNPSGAYFCGFGGDGGPALSAIFDSPSAVGSDASGNLVVLDNIRVRTVQGLVKGPSAATVVFPSPLAFPATLLGTSDTLGVIISNRGSSSVGISTVVISGARSSDFSETDNCVGHSLSGGGASCTINVTFAPSAAGVENALLTITDSVGLHTVSLSGTASDFSLNAANGGATSASIIAGQTATYTLQASPISGFSGSVSLACSGAPTKATCYVTPGVTVVGGSPASFTVTVTTTAPASASLSAFLKAFPIGPLFSGPEPMVGTLLFSALMLLLVARRRRIWASVGAGICLAVLLTSCGGSGAGGNGGSGGGSGGTPPGNYRLTITGTQQGVTRTLQLTLGVK